MARNRAIIRERKTASLLQNSLPSYMGKGGGVFRTSPDRCQQLPLACRDMAAFLRILGRCQASDDPRPHFSWFHLSPQVPNLTPILSSSLVSISRLILTGFSRPSYSFSLLGMLTYVFESRKFFQPNISAQTLPPPPFTSKSLLFWSTWIFTWMSKYVWLPWKERMGLIPQDRECLPTPGESPGVT